MLKSHIALVSILVLAAPSFSQSFDLSGRSAAGVPGVKPPAAPPAAAIAVYSTEEEFNFESEAGPAMNARIAALKAAGLTTLGGRVTEKGNDYTFVIEYLPTVKGDAVLPPAVLIETYRNGAAYWRDSDAEAEMKASAANFRAARLTVLGSYLYDIGSDSGFAVDYLQKNLLRPTREYDVKFESYSGGKFTFESEAAKAVPSYLALFRQAGVPAIRGRAVKRPDGDYSVEVEYVVKTNGYGRRPQYSVARYAARDVFPFDSEALKASKLALPRFSAAGVAPVSAVVRPEGRDYSYSVDFLVGNIYQQGGAAPAAAVQTYQSPETFTFDGEARKARDEKVAALNAGGLPVVGSAVTGSLGSYTYAVDFMVKAGQAGPVHPPQR